MAENNPKPPIKKRILELWTLGYTSLQTSNQLKKEGYQWGVSQRTVAGYLASLPKFPDPALELKEELLRRQLMDIAISDPDLRLRWRAHLLDKLFATRIHTDHMETAKEMNIDLRNFNEEEKQHIRSISKRMLDARTTSEG